MTSRFSICWLGAKRRMASRGAWKKVEEYRGVVRQRTSDIADYLNWWEATQMKSRSDTFDNYLKISDQISNEDRKKKVAHRPVNFDQLELEF